VAQADYIPGTCNIGGSEVNRRRMVALIGLIITLSSLATSITNDASRQARLGIFIPAASHERWLGAIKKEVLPCLWICWNI